MSSTFQNDLCGPQKMEKKLFKIIYSWRVTFVYSSFTFFFFKINLLIIRKIIALKKNERDVSSIVSKENNSFPAGHNSRMYRSTKTNLLVNFVQSMSHLRNNVTRFEKMTLSSAFYASLLRTFKAPFQKISYSRPKPKKKKKFHLDRYHRIFHSSLIDVYRR